MGGEDVIIYCDEAGNTGPNYLDPQQPFYVLAAWIIPYAGLADTAAEIEKHRQIYSPQAPELKSSNLLRTQAGREGAASLLETLESQGCMPLYVIAEKRYCVAGKIVETFLDPVFNPELNNAFVGDTVTKQEVANSLYTHLPPEVLSRFAEAYRTPDVAVFSRSLTEIVDSVRKEINPELAELLAGSQAQMLAIAETEANTSVFGNAGETVNLPALASMFMMIENMGRYGLISPRKFVHDETRAYEAGYRGLFELLKRAGNGIIHYPNGAYALFPLRHIPEFATARSHELNLIQAADVLAGSAAMLGRLALSGGTITQVDAKLATLIVPALLHGQPRRAWSIGSDNWVRALGRAYIGSLGDALPSDENSSPTSTEPDHSAVLLPAGNAKPEGPELPRFCFDLPIFGLVGAETGDLMHVKDQTNSLPGGTAVLLFTTRQFAQNFLTNWQKHLPLTEKMEVTEFDSSTIHVLMGLLGRSLEVTGILAFDCGHESQSFVELSSFLRGLSRVLDRVQRAAASGIIRKLFQRETVSGLDIMSMLTSDGTYLAAKYPDGACYSGRTREEAVKALLDVEGSRAQ